MRLLTFYVDSQHIVKDPKCDFNHIVAGTHNYLRAKFTFSSDWYGYIKVASFWRGEKEEAVMLNDDNTCDIPPEILTGATFRVSITGQRGDCRVTTNKVLVRQEVTA